MFGGDGQGLVAKFPVFSAALVFIVEFCCPQPNTTSFRTKNFRTVDNSSSAVSDRWDLTVYSFTEAGFTGNSTTNCVVAALELRNAHRVHTGEQLRTAKSHRSSVNHVHIQPAMGSRRMRRAAATQKADERPMPSRRPVCGSSRCEGHKRTRERVQRQAGDGAPSQALIREKLDPEERAE